MHVDDLLDKGCLNIPLFEDNYLLYKRQDPSLDPSWKLLFDQLENSSQEKSQKINGDKSVAANGQDWRIHALIQGYRQYGYLMANVDPLASSLPKEPPELKLENFGLSEKEMLVEFYTFGLLKEKKAPLVAIIDALKAIYCNKVGVEYMGLQNPAMEKWLQERIEPNHFKNDLSIDRKKMILSQLNKSEIFESFLHTKFVGQKRFSIEGGETLIPMLFAMIDTGSMMGIHEFVFGMAHRGRINVLSNIFNKSYGDIFSEFEEGYVPVSIEGSGDVKYHKGFYSEIETIHGHEIRLTLTPNPSHLESVDPVVQGQVLSKQIVDGDQLQEHTVPVLIHGDAAISGQGVVYETLQLSQVEGYGTGGTIHIVINNQIGFTTTPKEGRSTRDCTDIARTFGIVVFHVNAEDPENCIHVMDLAVHLRQTFHCDVFIELNCYRKYGHNEGDEPAFTQPLAYQQIRNKIPIREIYRNELISQGVLEKEMAEKLELQFKDSLQTALADKTVYKKALATEGTEDRSDRTSTETGVAKETLQEIAGQLSQVPGGFTLHQKLRSLLQERALMVQEGTGGKPINWGMAEILAYGSLLLENIDVRVSGQDACRGTFSHRHGVFIDQVNEERYISLNHLREVQGRFTLYNSPLSEYAVLGFDYGYSLGNPECLVVWEAQFGDFCNAAQVIIDQYIASAEQKWNKNVPLTLFLPHGYEGQGPEHSSGRMERFLALAGEDNMQIVNCTTPAQLFHVLRRQMVNKKRKPLVVFTPKGLLRDPRCVSSLADLTKGSFQEVLDDPAPALKTEKLVFCSGRIFYDLVQGREQAKAKEVTIIRLEQLYPVKKSEKAAPYFAAMIKKYGDAKQFFWVQEEPMNMGAWSFIGPILSSLLPASCQLTYIGRPRSAASAAGSQAIHKKESLQIMEALFGKSKDKP